ncbi:cation transporter [Asticcacaulis sp. BYS171W]|uniref:Cation transporter n=1 Tax=Asticcacaulis aquaticus TaxID=2984212 RepID=A0ABT5HXW9_9CAUL|nr:cation transporter [Asticcacaulis aquaticus]MDC7684914.1 cation transporter [Asticcacaulis aquaticus]
MSHDHAPGAHCHHDHEHGHVHDHSDPVVDPQYRKVLWWVMLINAAMFFVEIGAGYQSLSKSLLADSLDFAGDAINIALSLFVLTASVPTRAKMSLFKAASMFLFSIWIMGATLWQVYTGDVPKAEIMGIISVLAVVANLLSAWWLYKFREGDSNMMSVWLCARNDAIGNVLVMAAAVGVFFTHNTLPDAIVALVMVAMGLQAATQIARRAWDELQAAKAGA